MLNYNEKYNEPSDQITKIVFYLCRYGSEGIKFEQETKTLSEDSKRIDDDGREIFEAIRVPNETVDEPMVKRFCERRWEEEKAYYTKNDFFEREIKFIESTPKWVLETSANPIYPILKFFKEWEKNPDREVKKIPDYSYTLRIEDDPLFNGSEFDLFKLMLNSNGYTIKTKDKITAPVYTPQLARILTAEKIDVLNKNNQKREVINGQIFWPAYFEGYLKGVKFFNENYKISTDTLYGENCNVYVSDLHNQYFHKGISKARGGWNYVKKAFPLTLEYNQFIEFGYYSGIVSQVDELIKKYPVQFKDFEKCEPEKNQSQEEIGKERKKKTRKEIFAELDNDPQIQQMEKEFDRLDKLHKRKHGIAIPIGGVLFMEIKQKAPSPNDLIERLKYFEQQAYIWKKLSLAESELIGETEVSDRLIPLLENDIEHINGLIIKHNDKPMLDENENQDSIETEQENDVTLSTIDECIEQFKSKISKTDYTRLTRALKSYFEKGSFPTLETPINVKRVNKKKLGWALRELYDLLKKGNLSVDYLLFAHQNISTFQDDVFEIDSYQKSNLYKYFTTKTK